MALYYKSPLTNSQLIAQTITVGKDGADFSNIKDALDLITDNSESKPYTVLVYPGVYVEDNPIACKPYVSIISSGGGFVTRVVAQNVSSNLFNLSAYSSIRGFNLTGITSTGYALSQSVSGPTSIINCIIFDCANGILLNNNSGQMFINNCADSNSLIASGNSLDLRAGALTVNTFSIEGSSTITNIVYIDGSNCIATINNLISFSANVTKGFYVRNGARVVSNNCSLVAMTDGLVIDSGSNFRTNTISIFNAQNDGVRIDDVGSNTKWVCNGCAVEDSTGYDINILSATALIEGMGTTSIDKMNFVAGASMHGIIIDDKEDDEGVNVVGELHVGLPEEGAESVFGEGDSYTRGMLVYTETAVGAFTDVSTAARSASGSTFTFPGVAADNAIYIASSLNDGSDVITHFGIKSNVNTACVVGSGEILLEYWNGAAWTELNAMETQSSGFYYPYAKQYFEHTGSHQLRYDAELMHDAWSKNDPMSLGTDYYWVRFRIDTAITTAPIFEQFKLHTNRLEINSDGFLEYFGSARGIGVLPWDAGLLEAAAASPANQDLYLSDNLDVGRVENKFANGATDRIGFLSRIPLEIDTSSAINFSWSVITDDATAGNIDWVVRWGYVSDGGNVYRSQAGAPTTGPNEQSIVTSLAAPTAADTLKWYSVYLDISNMISRRDAGYGDTIFVSLQRTVGDTHAGDVTLVAISAEYKKWSEGGHI